GPLYLQIGHVKAGLSDVSRVYWARSAPRRSFANGTSCGKLEVSALFIVCFMGGEEVPRRSGYYIGEVARACRPSRKSRGAMTRGRKAQQDAYTRRGACCQIGITEHVLHGQ